VELLAGWTDAEDVGLALLDSLGTVVLATPVDLQPPLTVVRCIGGSDDKITNRPRLQIQSYGNTRVEARDLAEDTRQIVLASPGEPVAGISIDYAATEQAPSFVDYGQPGIHRYIAVYRVEYRRPR
jgi:hypothetical protein